MRRAAVGPTNAATAAPSGPATITERLRRAIRSVVRAIGQPTEHVRAAGFGDALNAGIHGATPAADADSTAAPTGDSAPPQLEQVRASLAPDLQAELDRAKATAEGLAVIEAELRAGAEHANAGHALQAGIDALGAGSTLGNASGAPSAPAPAHAAAAANPSGFVDAPTVGFVDPSSPSAGLDSGPGGSGFVTESAPADRGGFVNADEPTPADASRVGGKVSRRGDGEAGDHSIAALDHAAGGPAGSLPEDLRQRFETSLGADLSGVRVHTDGSAATAAQSFGALAFAHGQDLYFGAGQYQPGTSAGDHLIAHEVAHTVQQRSAPAGPQHKLEVSEPGDAMEDDADRAAAAMARGQPTRVGSTSPSRNIARQVASDGGQTLERVIRNGPVEQMPEIIASLGRARDSQFNAGSPLGSTMAPPRHPTPTTPGMVRIDAPGYHGQIAIADIGDLIALARSRQGGVVAPQAGTCAAGDNTADLDAISDGVDHRRDPQYLDRFDRAGGYNVLTNIIRLGYADGVWVDLNYCDVTNHVQDVAPRPTGGGVRLSFYLRDRQGRIRPTIYNTETAPRLLEAIRYIENHRGAVEDNIINWQIQGAPAILAFPPRRPTSERPGPDNAPSASSTARPATGPAPIPGTHPGGEPTPTASTPPTSEPAATVGATPTAEPAPNINGPHAAQGAEPHLGPDDQGSMAPCAGGPPPPPIHADGNATVRIEPMMIHDEQRWVAFDRESGIEVGTARIVHGHLRMDIDTRPLPPNRRAVVRGRDIYNALLAASGGADHPVMARWTSGMPDNLETFNSRLLDGLSENLAARSTHTGRLCSERHLTQVQVQPGGQRNQPGTTVQYRDANGRRAGTRVDTTGITYRAVEVEFSAAPPAPPTTPTTP